MDNGAVSSYGGHIDYREGVSGRRAVLVNGPDVWEVVTTEPDVPERARRIAAVAEYLSLGVESVTAAFAYYDDHRREIDAWVAENRRISEQAHAAWRASQAPSDG